MLDAEPDSSPASGGELAGLPSWLSLPEALSEDWLDELLEELLDGLPVELLGGVGGVEEGVGGVGGCGTVGVLALGQPTSNRQILEMPASCNNIRLFT